MILYFTGSCSGALRSTSTFFPLIKPISMTLLRKPPWPDTLTMTPLSPVLSSDNFIVYSFYFLRLCLLFDEKPFLSSLFLFSLFVCKITNNYFNSVVIMSLNKKNTKKWWEYHQFLVFLSLFLMMCTSYTLLYIRASPFLVITSFCRGSSWTSCRCRMDMDRLDEACALHGKECGLPGLRLHECLGWLQLVEQHALHVHALRQCQP